MMPYNEVDCPTPVYHETHMYCPNCTFRYNDGEYVKWLKIKDDEELIKLFEGYATWAIFVESPKAKAQEAVRLLRMLAEEQANDS